MNSPNVQQFAAPPGQTVENGEVVGRLERFRRPLLQEVQIFKRFPDVRIENPLEHRRPDIFLLGQGFEKLLPPVVVALPILARSDFHDLPALDRPKPPGEVTPLAQVKSH